MKFSTLLMAGAALVTLGSFSATAKADTVYVAPGTTVTTSTGPTKEFVHQDYTAVGTRKVGMVGYHPYPLQARHVETNTVNVNAPENDVTFRSTDGAPVATESSTVTTSRSTSPIAYSAGGGSYYTTAGTKYYRDPALNVNVQSTGTFNN